MNLITGLMEALHYSRQRDAERVIRRYQNLVEQAREHERKCKIEETSSGATGTAGESFATGGKLCVPQT